MYVQTIGMGLSTEFVLVATYNFINTSALQNQKFYDFFYEPVARECEEGRSAT